MNQQTKKRGRLVRLGAVISAFVVLLIAATAPMTAYAATDNKDVSIDSLDLPWDFHGIDISDRESIDAYFMDIEFKGHKEFYCVSQDGLPYSSDTWKRGNQAVGLLFIFPDAPLNRTSKNSAGKEETVSGNPYIIKETTLECPQKAADNWFVQQQKYVFTETKFTVSLSNGFYKWVKGSDYEKDGFNRIYITLLKPPYFKGNVAFADYWTSNHFFEIKTTFYSKAVSPDIANPNSPLFDINFGNNGDVTLPLPKLSPKSTETSTGCQDILSWLASFLGITVTTVTIILIIIGLIFLIRLFK